MNGDDPMTLGSFARRRLVAGAPGPCDPVPSAHPPATCRAGCGACCRQLVSISPAEALHLADVVDSLPGERRLEIRRRFDAAATLLKTEGLWDALSDLDAPSMTDEDHYNLARDYFRLGMPCPFLESGSCSIYEERPALCREYRVSSPREHCDDPFAREVAVIPSAVRLGDALGGLSAQMLKSPTRMIPLTLALAWVREHQEARTRSWDRAELEARFELHWDIMLGLMR